MINIPIETIIQKIVEQSDLTEKDVEQKIEKKLEQLSGLISKEGAAHIVANELGIKLMQTEGIIKIKDLLAGMRDAELNCKVIKKYEIRHFENARGQGKVFRFLVGDETGTTMVVLWNDKADLEKEFNEQDHLKLKQVTVRDNNGKTELHLGDQGEIIVNPEGVKIENKTTYEKATRKKISELTENENNVEIFATVVQVFDPKFFKVDSTGKRIKEEENPEGYTYGAVLNLFVDDGTENIRSVLWKNQIINFLNITEEQLLQYKDDPASFEEQKNKMLGSMIKLIGRTTKNEMFGKTEFVANIVITDVNPEEEITNTKKQEPQKEKTTEKTEKQEPTEKPTKQEPPKNTEKPKTDEEDDDLLSLEEIEDIDEDI